MWNFTGCQGSRARPAALLLILPVIRREVPVPSWPQTLPDSATTATRPLCISPPHSQPSLEPTPGPAVRAISLRATGDAQVTGGEEKEHYIPTGVVLGQHAMVLALIWFQGRKSGNRSFWKAGQRPNRLSHQGLGPIAKTKPIIIARLRHRPQQLCSGAPSLAAEGRGHLPRRASTAGKGGVTGGIACLPVLRDSGRDML